MNMLRKHRNNEIRESSVIAGELTALDDTPVNGVQYALFTLPPGVVAKDIYAISKGAGDVTATVTVGTSSFPLTTVNGYAGDSVDALITERTNVIVEVAAPIEYGRLVVGIKYIDLDIVNGDRVEPAEYIEPGV